ncbi:hypothetical protein SAY86_011522 [Trapa natans]|uniref:50S ribosomal protein 5, chloroplastic n=1 Tax=Trapa natans TaxID=22666 RepID=A0AAN7LMC2_TRANT|nr:hypothetical protein SAY86_011522 [Trapa natans]
MALLYCYSPLAALPLPSLPSPSPLAMSVAPVSRMPIKSFIMSPFSSPSRPSPLLISKRSYLCIRAVSDGAGPTAGETEPPQETKEEVVSVSKLPLESKLQERMEQKMRMKIAKKIRLRRKRLLRKRHMRKKGRWPPSKMKKLKNV